MRRVSEGRRRLVPPCRCPEIKPGEIAGSETLAHLVPVSSDERSEVSFLVCPLSGVIWRRIYREERTTVATTVRTDYQQPQIAQRTVAVASVCLYSAVRSPLAFPNMIYRLTNLPLQGLISGWVQSRQVVEWHCNGIHLSGKLQLGFWLELVSPLNMGECGTVAVASPLESLSQAALAIGNTFELYFGILGHTLGELTVLKTEQVPYEEFTTRFDASILQLDLYEEWWSVASKQH